MTITTTLNRIRAHSPCRKGWAKLLRHLGKTEADDEPCDVANEADLWRCTVCGRLGTVGRCCGEETREPALPDDAPAKRAPKASA